MLHHDVPLIAEWKTISSKQDIFMNDAFLKANKQQIHYNHSIVQEVFKYNKDIKGKLAPQKSCHFGIIHIHMHDVIIPIHLYDGLMKNEKYSYF